MADASLDDLSQQFQNDYQVSSRTIIRSVPERLSGQFKDKNYKIVLSSETQKLKLGTIYRY